VVICGAFVIGPYLINTPSSSIQLISGILEGKIPALANVTMPLVDVRDLAEAHIKALYGNFGNERIALCQESIPLPDIAALIKKIFEPYGFTKVTSAIQTDINKVPEYQRSMVDKAYTIDRTKSETLLGIQY